MFEQIEFTPGYPRKGYCNVRINVGTGLRASGIETARFGETRGSAKTNHATASCGSSQVSPPNVLIGGPACLCAPRRQVRNWPGFPLQPEADPSEALWRKKHAGMTDSGTATDHSKQQATGNSRQRDSNVKAPPFGSTGRELISDLNLLESAG